MLKIERLIKDNFEDKWKSSLKVWIKSELKTICD